MVYSNYDDILNNAACFVYNNPKVMDDLMESEFGGGQSDEKEEGLMSEN